MKLSDRDLKLLVILLIAVVIACPILFVLRPYNTKITETEATISQLKERQAFLAKLNENRQFYFDSIALLDSERNAIVENYAKGLRDENTVIFMANVEKQIPIAMTTLSFASGEPTMVSEDYVNENGETVEGLTALTSTTSVAYTTDYDGLKAFLNFILNYENKMVITSISAQQDNTDGKIKGVFVLNQYAVSGEGRELEAAKIPSMEHGVDNMFGEPQDLSEEAKAALEENAEETDEQ